MVKVYSNAVGEFELKGKSYCLSKGRSNPEENWAEFSPEDASFLLGLSVSKQKENPQFSANPIPIEVESKDPGKQRIRGNMAGAAALRQNLPVESGGPRKFGKASRTSLRLLQEIRLKEEKEALERLAQQEGRVREAKKEVAPASDGPDAASALPSEAPGSTEQSQAGLLEPGDAIRDPGMMNWKDAMSYAKALPSEALSGFLEQERVGQNRVSLVQGLERLQASMTEEE